MAPSVFQSKRLKGQAAVEFVFSVGIFLIIFVFLIKLGQFGLSRQEALSLACFGTSLQSCNLLDEEIMGSQIALFRKELKIYGNNPGGIETGRFTGVPGSSFYQLVKTSVGYGISPGLKGVECVVEQKAPLED